MVGNENLEQQKRSDEYDVRGKTTQVDLGSLDSYVSPTGRTDGRKPYEWESRYPAPAKNQMRLEAVYLSMLFVLSLGLIFTNWNGWLSDCLSIPNSGLGDFRKYTYYASSGLLGGVVFDIKNFYRSVASGWWHLDRRAWRLLSPLLGLATAFIIGAMIDASLLSTAAPTIGSACLSIGFLSGYFADKSIAKMGEIADVIFGKSVATKD